jgi:hypothetical protein
MADNIVYVIEDLGPPESYTAAHKIELGECVEIHTPASGCTVLFSQKVHHTCPKHIPYTELPNQEILYRLAGNGDFSFYFSVKGMLQFWVGAPNLKELAPIAAGSGHTVIVGGVGMGEK